MKKLSKKEIQFIKGTGWTPTVFQCDEWYRTIWTNEKISSADFKDSRDYISARDEYSEKYYLISCKYAQEHYNVDLDKLYKKCVQDIDGISLENDATYLLYTFFSQEELSEMNDEQITTWLKDFKYFGGYRKWDGGNYIYANEALEVYSGVREFYTLEDGSIWNRLK